MSAHMDTETATTERKRHRSWWCAACGSQHEWRAPNIILVVQLGTNPNEAKVFKAHAAPQGLCDNLINALKLLANHPKDGDSPIRSFVTGLHERSTKGNHGRAKKLHRSRQPQCGGSGSFAQGHKAVLCPEAEFQEYQVAAIRDELTLRADEVGTLKACVLIDHIEDDRWEPQLVDADWHAFCLAIYRGIEGMDEKCCAVTTEMSRAAKAK